MKKYVKFEGFALEKVKCMKFGSVTYDDPFFL